MKQTLICALAISTAACLAGGKLQPVQQTTGVDVGQLWQAPDDLEQRNLYYGTGGPELAPQPTAEFTYVASDNTGYSPGYDVRGPDGMEWSVKLGPEAQPEVAVSRILWALGYHQPPTYYVTSWTMTGEQARTEGPARFRPKLPDRKVVGEWSWYENEFLDAQPFKGLVVANVMLNNWDWKTSNNKIYEIAGPDGAARVYVVQDLGASLGKTAYPAALKWLPMRGIGQGSRNELEHFEEQGFIKGVEGNRVAFHYRGIHRSLIESITARDVRWTSELMARLSDAQWHDAFRAAGYTEEQSKRYVAKIKGKVAEGLALNVAG